MMEHLLRAKFYAASAFLLLLGITLSWWPSCALAVFALLAGRHYGAAVGLALLLDVAYGAPPGPLHIVSFPLTFCALALFCLSRWGERVFFDRRSRDSL
jgi:hypothetical protein